MFSAPQVEFLSYCRIECGLAESTLEAYGRDIRDFCNHMTARGNAGVATVRLVDIAEHVQWLSRERKLEATTIARHLASVRVLFRWMHAMGRIPNDPARLVERPMKWQRVPDAMTPGQMKKLVESPSPDHGDLWLRDRAILELMYAAGLRASEVCTTKLNDFSEVLGCVTVIGKGNKQRIVPIGVPSIQWLKRWIAESRPLFAERGRGADRHRLFLSHSGRPLERVALWQIIRRCALRAGMDHIHPHKLRHSFATHLVMGGADLRLVQELLGHANVTTTQVYTHVDQSNLHEVIAQFHPRARLGKQQSQNPANG